ncbi:hypothetical protein [Streptomyces sp. NPDC096142]|uniref:hypothetical protein n=1 Tax=Streptomyces sp. NPDC096142 TaxID=3366077 RepID=UPI003822F360
MLGKIADCLRSTELQAAERAALDQGTDVRRGQGPPAAPAQRKARREYETGGNAFTP